MKILSLFDGMACGMIAMLDAQVQVDEYVAYEIDKYAIKTSSHNFPMIKHGGDVFLADFTQYKGFDYLIGGSPCTYWSIAQTQHRETVASGMGWELFSQYVRALHEAKPKFFIYENNKSMSNAIRQSITETFGFEPICINSALVSAQNRQRLYWVGKREADGSYSKVDVEQPEDRGIFLRDILESGEAWQDKSFAYTTRCQAATIENTLAKHQHTMVAEPCAVNLQVVGRAKNAEGKYDRSWEARSDGKASTITTVESRRMVAEAININPSGHGMNGCVMQIDGKSRTLTTNKGEGAKIIVPVGSHQVGSMPRPNGELSTSQGFRVYDIDAKSVTLRGNAGGAGGKTGLYAMPVHEATKAGVTYINPGECVDLSMPNSKTRRGRAMREKCNCLTTSCEYYEYCGTIEQPIYQVKDGMITIKGKQYPIKLKDGCYIIRKLTVKECMRLQTVPEWYEFPVSNAQAYKMLGNGWTCDVISHLIKATINT